MCMGFWMFFGLSIPSSLFGSAAAGMAARDVDHRAPSTRSLRELAMVANGGTQCAAEIHQELHSLENDGTCLYGQH